MSDSVSTTDRILDIIDAGLQTPEPDPTFGEVSPEVHDRCARCEQHEPAKGGDLCEGCRAFLLGDSEHDPQASGQWLSDEQWDNCIIASPVAMPSASSIAATAAAVGRMAGVCVQEAVTAMNRFVESFRRTEYVQSCEALGLAPVRALELLSAEVDAGSTDYETSTKRALARAHLDAAGLNPGPPGIQGDIWRRMFDPNRTPPPANELDYWWRRTRAANEAREPLTVTPEQYREIRLLCPDPLDPLAPFRLRAEDGARETLFGVELTIEGYGWADADRIQFRTEIEAS